MFGNTKTLRLLESSHRETKCSAGRQTVWSVCPSRGLDCVHPPPFTDPFSLRPNPPFTFTPSNRLSDEVPHGKMCTFSLKESHLCARRHCRARETRPKQMPSRLRSCHAPPARDSATGPRRRSRPQQSTEHEFERPNVHDLHWPVHSLCVARCCRRRIVSPRAGPNLSVRKRLP